LKTAYKFALSLAGAILLVALLVAGSFWAFNEIEDAAGARSHTRIVLRSVDELFSSLKDMETGQRGFLLTGDEAFLEPYSRAIGTIGAQQQELRQLILVPEARHHFDALTPLIEAKLAEMAETIAMARKGETVAVQTRVRVGRGMQLMDSIRAEVHSIITLQEGVEQARDAQFRESMRLLFGMIVVASVLALLLALAFGVYVRRDFLQRVKDRIHLETKRLLAIQEDMNAELQRAYVNLQVGEEKLEVTLSSIGDGVLATDAEGRVTLLNPVAAKLTGWTQAEATGRTVDEIFRIINQETRQPATVPVSEALAKGTIQGLANHTVLLARDGTECAIADSCAPIRARDERIVGAVLVFRDVTKEYAIQKTLHDKNVELAEATLAAEKANLAKSEFLSNMSHEIRTPMNAIIGMSYLALKAEMPPRQRDTIKKIQDSSRHLLAIINDILDISKIEAGKLTIENTDFELEKVLEHVAGLMSGKTSAKGLELVVDVDKNVPRWLIGDPLRLGQILINYSNNAVKFTEHGEVDIVIRVKEQTDAGVVLYCAVRDTGIGVSGEQIGRLFRSFEQADTSTTRKFGGTGLGLVISKKLAELMGGEVGVESEPGKGSTFWFTARLGRSAGSRRKLALSGSLRGKRVLVVDDNENARLVLSDLLGGMSFNVDQVESGRAALDAVGRAEAQDKPYEIVFLDWMMPGMDGIETARHLRGLSLGHAPHLMMVTAYGREDVIKGAENAGIKNVLIKPVSASMLFDGVVGLLGGTVDAPSGGGDVPTDAYAQLSALKGARILLVEDNDLNQEVATQLLREAGFVVDLAENGQVAVDRVRAAEYDLVLMDMQMPVMDGVTATREIRKEAHLAGLPIVAMTANAMPADRDRCIAAGMNDHLSKPIEPEDLWKALLKWIKLPQASAPPAAAPAQSPAGENVPQGGSEGDLPSGIDGLDMAAALRRVLGNRLLYLSMLRKFVAGQGSAMAETRAAIERDDWDAAERLVHTLKGSCASIGASGLQPLAARLEASIRERQPAPAVSDCIEELTKPLDEMIGRLARQLPREQPRKIVDVDRLALKGVCDNLEALLADSNAAAGALWLANADLFGSAFPGQYDEIDKDIRSFNFAAARKALSAANAMANG